MTNYDKNEVKESLTLENVYQLLSEWGGEPQYTSFGILSATICHNLPGRGSKKLYYYASNRVFHCYTDCGSMDIFDLFMKISALQYGKECDLNTAVRYIAQKFSIKGTEEEFSNFVKDKSIWDEYERIQQIKLPAREIVLKEYDASILEHLNYKVHIMPWLLEGISQQTIEEAKIGYYAGGMQITIPHYDVNNRFIGLRGRTLSKEDAERFGKYRPVTLGGQLYNHPLGMNLYNLNRSKENIKFFGKAIVFEGEKSTLLYRSCQMEPSRYDISVATCGSNLSYYQFELLRQAGAKEIVIAYDRQFQKRYDKEYRKWKEHLQSIQKRYNNEITISYILDDGLLTGYKDSPIDKGIDIFNCLYRKRIFMR